MENHIYVKYTKDENFVEVQESSIKKFCDFNNIDFQADIIKKNTINKILKKVSRGDSLIIYNLNILGNTIYKVLTELFKISEKDVKIISTNPNFNILNGKTNQTFDLLKILYNIEKENIERRIILAQKSCKSRNKKLGRKKGLKTKSIYDKHKKTIFKLFKLKVPKTKIIEEIGVGTPQGLGKYIKKIIEQKKIELNMNKSGFDLGLGLLTKK